MLCFSADSRTVSPWSDQFPWRPSRKSCRHAGKSKRNCSVLTEAVGDHRSSGESGGPSGQIGRCRKRSWGLSKIELKFPIRLHPEYPRYVSHWALTCQDLLSHRPVRLILCCLRFGSLSPNKSSNSHSLSSEKTFDIYLITGAYFHNFSFRQVNIIRFGRLRSPNYCSRWANDRMRFSRTSKDSFISEM